jgi:hypothetical protein
MQDDEEFDGTLLVETILGGPDVSYYLRSSGGNLLDYVGLGLLIAGLFAFALIVLAPHSTMDKTIRAVGVLAITGRWVCWALTVAGLLYPLYKIWDAANTSKIRQHIFSSDGIQLSRSESSTLLPWSSVSRAVETPKGFLFYQRSRIAAFVPAAACKATPRSTSSANSPESMWPTPDS